MKLEIWGSGGGEGYPAIFCNCENCERARAAKGRSIRSLSQTCIDGELVIDLPADTGMHLQRQGFSLGNVENILITHAHSDHYAPTIFNQRGGAYAHGMKYQKVNVYGSDVVKKCFDGQFEVFSINDEIRSNINLRVVEPFTTFAVGRYEVTALPAIHAPELRSLNYLIFDGKTAVLYLLDSGYPKEEIFAFLEKYERKIGCVVLDATMGNAPAGTYIYHMSFEEDVTLKKELLRRRLVDERALFIATHITHNRAGTHEEVEAFFQKEDILVAYDGFTVEF